MIHSRSSSCTHSTVAELKLSWKKSQKAKLLKEREHIGIFSEGRGIKQKLFN